MVSQRPAAKTDGRGIRELVLDAVLLRATTSRPRRNSRFSVLFGVDRGSLLPLPLAQRT